MSDEPELIIKWSTKESEEEHDNCNPYHVCDGNWGGMGGAILWYRGWDTSDVFEINGGLEDVEIVRVWRNKEQKWDKNVLPTDYGQLRREVNLYKMNSWRQEQREFIEKEKALGHKFPRYFNRVVSPKIAEGKDLEALRNYDYDIRKVLLETKI